MAGTFILGETKVRPGTYFNIQKKGGNATAGVMNGVTAVIFRADFGPLNETKLMPLWMHWHLPRISRQRLSSPAP